MNPTNLNEARDTDSCSYQRQLQNNLKTGHDVDSAINEKREQKPMKKYPFSKNSLFIAIFMEFYQKSF